MIDIIEFDDIDIINKIDIINIIPLTKIFFFLWGNHRLHEKSSSQLNEFSRGEGHLFKKAPFFSNKRVNPFTWAYQNSWTLGARAGRWTLESGRWTLNRWTLNRWTLNRWTLNRWTWTLNAKLWTLKL